MIPSVVKIIQTGVNRVSGSKAGLGSVTLSPGDQVRATVQPVGLKRVAGQSIGLSTVTSKPVNPLRTSANPNGLNRVTVAIGSGLTGVSSFNGRIGAVVLLDADITSALGYTPANPANLTFAGLSDVKITNPKESDTPQYDATQSKWVNIPQTSITDGGNF